VSYKNPSPALPILLADFIKLFSSIAYFGLWFMKNYSENPVAFPFCLPASHH